ncbi:protein odr-4 homolog isoform X3 [Dendronephthya gigantea]|uniref:protein odr-4 homolog isoform X3 n=1 Tax=Dendronephthya gigantea TaxID=151771 RepID=UPI0010697114|nr:protein odr-4 homolog isoform X3 [Dendronephthya gigantea]
MGRSVFIEEVLEDRILKLFGETKWASGVLIGQSTLQRDYIVHLSFTPPQDPEDSPDDSSDRKEAVNEFDEEWFVQHCCQLNSMLTGGLRILGIFVFGPPELRKKLQAKFRQTLYAIHKTISNEVPLGKWELGQNSNQVMVQVCSATKKTTCYAIDVSDAKANMQPADLKYQSFISKWIPVRCPLAIEVNLMLQKKLGGKTSFTNLKNGLMPFLSKVANSLATINGVIINNEQLLVSEKQSKRTSSEKNQTKNVNLYLTESEFEPDIKASTTRQVLLVGLLESRAHLHPKATIKEAIDAIKTDIIRNLLARCRLVCEDLDDTQDKETKEDEQDEFTRLELPKRIFAPIRRGEASICDCVFKDENTNDVLNRILELTGISVCEEDLVSDENFADDGTLDELVTGDKTPFISNKNVEHDDNSIQRPSSYQFFGVGALTALMAAMYQWFFRE